MAELFPDIEMEESMQLRDGVKLLRESMSDQMAEMDLLNPRQRMVVYRGSQCPDTRLT
eukprot:COSAG02_NODE_19506_length_878_cov_3.895599_2_plen_58_part_00